VSAKVLDVLSVFHEGACVRADSSLQNLIEALRLHLAADAGEAGVLASSDPEGRDAHQRSAEHPEHLQADFVTCRLTVLPVTRRPGWVRFDLDLLSLGLAEVEARREALLLLHQVNHATLALHPWRVCIDDECTLILTASLAAHSISSVELPAFLEEAMAQGQRVVGLWQAASVAASVADRVPPPSAMADRPDPSFMLRV
jgi:hypothetical protein